MIFSNSDIVLLYDYYKRVVSAQRGSSFQLSESHVEIMLIVVIPFFNVLQAGSHHVSDDFAVRGKEPKDEVQIYTWKDASLRELTDLVDPLSLSL